MKRCLVIIFCAMPSLAFAYIDPGTGAYVVQALFALIAAGLAYIRHPLKALKVLWKRLRYKDRD